MIRDVSYFVCMALSVADRRRHERRLLERYLARMEASGVGITSPNEAWELHRLHAAYTVPAAAPAVLPVAERPADQRAYARAFAERASAAVADLDAASALRTALTAR